MKYLNIDSKYKILEVLGKGSFSKVYKVAEIGTNNIFALKVVEISNLKEKEKLNSFKETSILSKINSPYIIKFIEAFINTKDNTLCLIMEYAESGDLSELIKSYRNKKKRFTEEEIINFSEQVLMGLNHLHSENVFHRDLKSANIFLSKDNVKIGDFNVSIVVVKNQFAYTQTGTPFYAAPEIWRDEPYNYKVDIWAFGCILYEMCMLRPPFISENAENLNKKIQKAIIGEWDNYYNSNILSIIKECFNINYYKRPDSQDLLNTINSKLKNNKENLTKLKTSQDSKQLSELKLNFLKSNKSSCKGPINKPELPNKFVIKEKNKNNYSKINNPIRKSNPKNPITNNASKIISINNYSNISRDTKHRASSNSTNYKTKLLKNIKIDNLVKKSQEIYLKNKYLINIKQSNSKITQKNTKLSSLEKKIKNYKIIANVKQKPLTAQNYYNNLNSFKIKSPFIIKKNMNDQARRIQTSQYTNIPGKTNIINSLDNKKFLFEKLNKIRSKKLPDIILTSQINSIQNKIKLNKLSAIQLNKNRIKSSNLINKCNYDSYNLRRNIILKSAVYNLNK